MDARFAATERMFVEVRTTSYPGAVSAGWVTFVCAG